MTASFEGGVRPTQFWKWAVAHEERARLAHRHGGRLRHSGSAPSLPTPSTIAEHEPVWDHGLIFPSLHDIHRQQERAKAGVRLPPVASGHSPKGHSPWGWASSGYTPQDVESALTVASSAAVTSLLGSAVAPRAASIVSATSALPAAAAAAAADEGLAAPRARRPHDGRGERAAGLPSEPRRRASRCE
mmetsp:Transcript_105928/g.328986  ORF Transcript_105928/g.328986 Transcript_105928/m.328986 type:complete len:188 (+) Transcript_105928:135-698(+)